MRECERMMELYALHGPDEPQLLTHLQSCPECAAMIRKAENFSEFLSTVSDLPPAGPLPESGSDSGAEQFITAGQAPQNSSMPKSLKRSILAQIPPLVSDRIATLLDLAVALSLSLMLLLNSSLLRQLFNWIGQTFVSAGSLRFEGMPLPLFFSLLIAGSAAALFAFFRASD